jgi:hypothetical protein
MLQGLPKEKSIKIRKCVCYGSNSTGVSTSRPPGAITVQKIALSILVLHSHLSWAAFNVATRKPVKLRSPEFGPATKLLLQKPSHIGLLSHPTPPAGIGPLYKTTFENGKVQLDYNSREFVRVRKSTGKTPLPLHFIPASYTVVIGRGKLCSDAPGNKSLFDLSSMFLEQYSKAACKLEKTEIISKIVETLQRSCPVGVF